MLDLEGEQVQGGDEIEDAVPPGVADAGARLADEVGGGGSP